MTLNATALRDTACTRCGATIRLGERMRVFRERALSSAEARNAGTLYPRRRWCRTCATGPVEDLPDWADTETGSIYRDPHR